MNQISLDSELQQLLNDFFDYLQLRMSHNTVRSYKYDIYQGITVDSTWDELNHVSKVRWREYLLKRRTAGLNYLARAFAAWRSFFGFCQNQGKNVTSGFLKIQIPKVRSKIFHIPESDEINAYIISEEQDWIKARNAALIGLLYSTGLRINEALNIQGWNNNETLRVIGKGNKIRDVPILEIVRELIIIYRKLCPLDTSHFLFLGQRGKTLQYSTVYNMMSDAPWGPGAHGLRRSAATHLLRNGMDVESVRILLGHTALSTTQRYIINDSQHLQKQYNAAQRATNTDNLIKIKS